MKFFITLVTVLISLTSILYGQSHVEEIEEFQKELNAEFLNPKESPLPKKERRKFTGHNYFPIDETYRVTASFKKYEAPVAFQMKTSNDRLKDYDTYAVAEFEVNGETHQLNIYQSHSLRQMEGYKDYLFIPFTDLTSGVDTYGGGRYIDLRIPEGDSIIIDFNKAYSPSCAYSYNYSCPIPPAENDLNIRIEAGVKNLH